ncbi:MAG TPA: FAD-dependent oxidoreductase [Longilinea sp.]|nr:FAD-dependent oxidoreductase [Longilinea sp.]
MNSKPHAAIIGGGFTGCALALDLQMRGFQVKLFERGEICAGTSGRTHGLLHSGGRYCVDDVEAGRECIQENRILRKIARQCIEFNGGLFIALNDSDVSYGDRFTKGAEECGIETEELTAGQAITLEPNLNPALLKAYTVPDGSFDPLRLALSFAATARRYGAEFYSYCEVTHLSRTNSGRISGLEFLNRHENQLHEIRADVVINATGAWAGNIAAMVNVTVPVRPTPGVMVAYDQRLVQRVINRLCIPDDGDILVPQRRMVLIGTTSFDHDDVDYIPVYHEQIKLMHERAAELVPAVKNAHPRGAWMSARPLIASQGDTRSLTRTFRCFDHEEQGAPGLITITGGKATTCRLMAEKTADLVCQKLGVPANCQTHDLELDSYRQYYARAGN